MNTLTIKGKLLEPKILFFDLTSIDITPSSCMLITHCKYRDKESMTHIKIEIETSMGLVTIDNSILVRDFIKNYKSNDFSRMIPVKETTRPEESVKIYTPVDVKISPKTMKFYYSADLPKELPMLFLTF